MLHQKYIIYSSFGVQKNQIKALKRMI